MDNTAKEAEVYRIFEQISEGYDRANDRISLGLQKKWKRMLTDRLVRLLPPGASVLDVCCGTGDIALETAKRRPDLHVAGIDFSPSMLRVAWQRRQGIPNVRLCRASAMELPCADRRFAASCISFGLRNTADYERVLQEMRRVTKPGGLVFCLDSFVPDNRLARPFYRLYFRHLMPVLGGGAADAPSYRWLYTSTEQFLRREALEDLFCRVGLQQVRSERRMFGACVLIWGRV